MTATQPPRRSNAQNVLWFWVGLVCFAAIGVIGYFSGASLGLGLTSRSQWLIVGAIAMLAVTAGLGIFAIRRRNIPLGSGLLVGYALATVFSAGECTFWQGSSGGYGFLAGFIYYAMALAVGLVVLLVAFGVEAFASRRQR